MKLNITKPLVIVKVHTTGLDFRTDRIVGITIKRFEPDGKQKAGTRFINPERDIPQDAVAIHGITNERVEKEKTFDQMGKNLYDFINDADIAGFNVKFDIEMLMNEFNRVGLNYTVYNRDVIDLYEAYMKFNPRTFAAAIAQYIDPNFQSKVMGTEEYADLCTDLMDAMLKPLEGAGDDVVSILKKQGINTKTLDIRGWFVLNANGKPVFNTGKYKGQPVADSLMADSGYYDWMRSAKADLPKDVLALAERILKKAKSTIVEGA